MVDDIGLAARKAVRESHARAGKRGEDAPLIPVPCRLRQDDYDTLVRMADDHARDVSFMIRAAVRMLAEAYRRNPRMLDV